MYHQSGVPNLLSYGKVCKRTRESEAIGDEQHLLPLNQKGDIFCQQGQQLIHAQYDCAKDSMHSAQKWVINNQPR